MDIHNKIYYHGRRVSRTKFYGKTIYITDNKKYAKLYSDGSDIYCFKIPIKVHSKIFSILNEEHFNEIKDTIHPYKMDDMYDYIKDKRELNWSDIDIIGSILESDKTPVDILSERGFLGIYLNERENIDSILIFDESTLEFIGTESFDGKVSKINELHSTSYGQFTDNYRGVSAIDPGISFEPFNRHYQTLQSTYKRLNDISTELTNSSIFKRLKNELILDDQNITSLKIIRILPNNANIYNAYVEFMIGEDTFNGVIIDVVGYNPTFKSNVFKSGNLVLTKEWIIRISGLIIKTVVNWISPNSGNYVSLKDDILSIDQMTGAMVLIDKGTLITVTGSDEKRNIVYIEINHRKLYIKGKNYVYFNYYFEPQD